VENAGEEVGRIYFSSLGRSLEFEDEIRLLTVGVDIGSSTSHLVFSRVVLERTDNRYLVVEREVLHESGVLLTPYLDNAASDIDAGALGRFIEDEYRLARLSPESVDTGALILTGVAVRRSNARAIADLFAAQAGKFVSVSAGDALESTLAAYGSGAAARSIRESARVMNVDIGGGTSKIAVCEGGEVVDVTAIDIGARTVNFDEQGRVQRIEPAGERFASEVGLALRTGDVPSPDGLRRMADRMAERLFEAMSSKVLSQETASLLRLEPLKNERAPDAILCSGGVSEYIYGREQRDFGDLGARLAEALLARVRSWGPRIEIPEQRIRATVIGASQYTVQVSGSTIFVAPQSALPLRNVPVIVPDLALDDDPLDAERIAAAVSLTLRRHDLQGSERPVALAYRWQGSASYTRLDAFCRGIATGLSVLLDRGLPLVLVGERDIGGLIGIHCLEEARLPHSVVSIDGIALSAFDFIDIGEIISTSGAVPVVIKSLLFPSSAALGRN